MLVLPPKRLKRRGNRNLGERFALKMAVKPAEPFHHRRAVARVRLTHARKLRLIFSRFQPQRRVLRPDDEAMVGNGVMHGLRGFFGIKQQHGLLRDLPQKRQQLIIIRERHAIGLQRGRGGFRQFRRIDEQPRLALRNRGVGDDKRIVGNIAAANIEQPRDVVERGNDVQGSPEFAHRLADAGKFRSARFAAETLREQERRHCRNRRAIRPDRGGEILMMPKFQRFMRADFPQFFELFDGHDAPIEADSRAARQFRRQPILILRHAGHFRFEQFDAGIGQLLRGLNEIAGIRPKPGAVARNDEDSGRAGKTGQPGAGLPMRRDVFALMRIAVCRNPRINAALRHDFPQCGNFFACGHEYCSVPVFELACCAYVLLTSNNFPHVQSSSAG